MPIKFIISNIFLLFGILSQTDMEISFHKSNLKIELENYNGIKYIPIGQLSKIFVMNKEVISNEYSLQFKEEELIFSEFSFFVVYKSNAQMRVAQMSHTAIKINNQLCIPVLPFFNSMNSLNLINSQINNGKLIDIIDYSIFEKQIPIKKIENEIEKISESYKISLENDTIIKRKKIKSKDLNNIFEFNKNQEIERGKYIIPRSIKK